MTVSFNAAKVFEVRTAGAPNALDIEAAHIKLEHPTTNFRRFNWEEDGVLDMSQLSEKIYKVGRAPLSVGFSNACRPILTKVFTDVCHPTFPNP